MIWLTYNRSSYIPKMISVYLQINNLILCRIIESRAPTVLSHAMTLRLLIQCARIYTHVLQENHFLIHSKQHLVNLYAETAVSGLASMIYSVKSRMSHFGVLCFHAKAPCQRDRTPQYTHQHVHSK